MEGALLAALFCLCGGCGGGERDDAPAAPVGVEVGNRAPQLRGRLHTGEPFALAEQPGTVLLVFYRGGDCGLCRVRLRRLQHHLAEYQALGAAVFAVTPDSPQRAAATARDLALGFPLVSVDTAALRSWAVGGAGARPDPAAYLVGEDGTILYRHLGRNAGDRSSDAAMLALLQQLSPRR
jgi:peroxiredoxin